MTCQHNTYKSESNIIDCICSGLEDGKKHIIFKKGAMTRDKCCPLKFGKIETENIDNILIIKKKLGY